MNHDEAKTILLRYRHGTTDAEDPQVAEALALAECDQGLKDWLAAHGAHESVVREKLRKIIAPAGLKEQIISEQAAHNRMRAWQKNAALTGVVVMLLLLAFGLFWTSRSMSQDTLAIYQNQMAGVALRGYAMDVVTNDLVTIRSYLAQNHAPADFGLATSLGQAAVTGCAVEDWRGTRVAMVCFRTRQASPQQASDLWLFIVERKFVRELPAEATPQISKVNRLMTATWIQGNQLYFLGTTGDLKTLQEYL